MATPWGYMPHEFGAYVDSELHEEDQAMPDAAELTHIDPEPHDEGVAASVAYDAELEEDSVTTLHPIAIALQQLSTSNPVSHVQ